MGDWQQILFERRLLSWSSLVSVLGLVLWCVALGSQHWLVELPASNRHNITLATPSPLLSPPCQGRGLIWSHSGLYSLSSLVEGAHSLHWEMEDWTLHRLPSLRSELIMAGFSLLLGLAAISFSLYSVRRPYMILRRLAAVLHLLVCACLVTVLQLVGSQAHTGRLHPVRSSHTVHYGYSFLLAWVAAIVFFFVSLAFCCASKKRKLLRNDNVSFRNQRLIIEKSDEK